MSVWFAWCHVGGLDGGEYYHGKGSVFFFCHHAVVSSDIVKLSASFRFVAVANGHHGGAYGECLGVEDVALMKIEVSV